MIKITNENYLKMWTSKRLSVTTYGLTIKSFVIIVCNNPEISKVFLLLEILLFTTHFLLVLFNNKSTTSSLSKVFQGIIINN